MVYLLGVLGTTFHLANGVYTASFIHGLAASPRAQRRMQVVSVALFVVLLGVGWGAVAGVYVAGVLVRPAGRLRDQPITRASTARRASNSKGFSIRSLGTRARKACPWPYTPRR